MTPEIDAVVRAHIEREMRTLEQRMVTACRAGEPYVDVPDVGAGGITRYLLPKTWLGRWWKLRKAGYSMRP